MTNDHGQCKECGFDLNGEWIYEYFLERYDEEKALKTASMYGATKTEGRFGKAILIKSYDENYNKLPSWWKCPECGEECR